jgi:hypothetical protein
LKSRCEFDLGGAGVARFRQNRRGLTVEASPIAIFEAQKIDKL